jgi:antitoxin YefM
MIMPRALTYSRLRAELKSVLDEVCDSREAVYVERRHGGDAVILAREDYEALDTTAHLLRSSANARRLMEAANAAPSEFVPVPLDTLRREIEER